MKHYYPIKNCAIMVYNDMFLQKRTLTYELQIYLKRMMIIMDYSLQENWY